MLSILDRRRSAPCFSVIAKIKTESAFSYEMPTEKNTPPTKAMLLSTLKTLLNQHL